MRFNGYKFNFKPSSIKFIHSANVIHFSSPFCNKIQNLGNNKIEVHGDGFFIGKDCVSQYQSVSKLVGTLGILAIPGHKPTSSYLKQLTIESRHSSDMLFYKFIFVEV